MIFGLGSSTQFPPFDAKALPSEETLTKASELEISDDNGTKVTFGSLIEKKVVVVFIRHFFCGACLLYSQNLARVPKEALDAAGVQIILIGCGEHVCIKEYRELCQFTGPIYADPTRTLFHTLGMTNETVGGGQPEEARPSYLATTTTWGLISSSLKRIATNVGFLGKQGNFSQNGGEFVLGPGKKCSFAARMEHSINHVPVEDLMHAAGVEYVEEAKL